MNQNLASDEPKTKEDFLLYRSIYYGASGASFVTLIQIIGKSYSALNIIGITFLAAASLGFLVCGAIYEKVAIKWEHLKRHHKDSHKGFVKLASNISLLLAFIGAAAAFHKPLNIDALQCFIADRGSFIIAAVVIALLSLAVFMMILFGFTNSITEKPNALKSTAGK
ncbi:hypothetical protein [Thiomonas intermedia]|uniref:hypothetical protein n=1 Tax=Thiomonas intermedia TaxID=926 RepID=UPI0009A50408|nr:hypothetical protein [Thiomonas intermedia]